MTWLEDKTDFPLICVITSSHTTNMHVCFNYYLKGKLNIHECLVKLIENSMEGQWNFQFITSIDRRNI